MEHGKKIEIGVLLPELSPRIKSNIGSKSKGQSSTGTKSNPDPYGKMIDLVNEVCKKDRFIIDLYEQWFQFILNIYPKLDEKEKGSTTLRKEIDNLRNNLIHSFYKFDVDDFRQAVISLRGKLLVYSYAKQVYEIIIKSLIYKNPDEIKKELEKQLEEVKNQVILTEKLPSEEADKLFGYRVETCLYFPLVKEPSQQEALLTRQKNIKELVIDYWQYLLPVDFECAKGFSNHEFEDKKEDKNYAEGKKEDKEELDGVKRRELFEKFLALKRTKKNFPEYYDQEKESLKSKVDKYGCSALRFDQICKKIDEDDQELYKKTNANDIVDKIVEFISIIQSAKGNLGCREESFISIARDILRGEDKHVKKLVLSHSQSIEEIKKKLKLDAERNEKIRQLKELQEDLREMFIEEKEGRIQKVEKMDKNQKRRKVTEAVIDIIETLFNAYNEYKVDFNLKEIFATRSFLNELTVEIKNDIPIIIERLIVIDYMSPLVSCLIVNESKKEIKNNESKKVTKNNESKKETKNNESKKVTNNINLEKLIDNLLSDKEYADYLKDLLQVNCYENFNFYETFYSKVGEKDISIKTISSIFKELNNIKGFIDVLVDKHKDSNDDWQEKKKIIESAMSVLEIINKEIAEEYYYKKTDLKYVSNILNAAEKLNKFREKIEEKYTGFIDISILKAKIKNKEKHFDEALTALNDSLENNFKKKDLLKASYLLTKSDIAYTYKLKENYAEAQESYTDLYYEIIRYSLNSDIKMTKVDPKFYEEVKDLKKYKSLLHHSEWLQSEKYLNVLNILADIAYMTLKLGKSDEKALEIYQEVYRFRKEELGSDHNKTVQILGYIASTNKKIGNKHKKNKQFSDALYYLLSALLKYCIIYDARKKLLGHNHTYVLNTAKHIDKTLDDIAFTHNELSALPRNIWRRAVEN